MVGHQKAKMGPLARVNPYYKNYKERVNAFFHSGLCTCVQLPH